MIKFLLGTAGPAKTGASGSLGASTLNHAQESNRITDTNRIQLVFPSREGWAGVPRALAAEPLELEPGTLLGGLLGPQGDHQAGPLGSGLASRDEGVPGGWSFQTQRAHPCRASVNPAGCCDPAKST